MTVGFIFFLPNPGSSETTTPSLYELSVALADQDAKSISFDVFRGYPTLVSMVYASCPYTCPMIISTLQKIEEAVPEKARADIRVLLVSLDPAHDTPEAMKAALQRHKVDMARWRFAVASDAATRDLAAVLGVKYRSAPGGDINHNAVFTVLDRNGRVVRRFEGLKTPTADVAKLLDTLVNTPQ
jgi:protein SCO1/2